MPKIADSRSPAPAPDLISSIDETISLTESSSVSDTLSLALPRFISFAECLKPIIHELQHSTDPDVLPIKKAVESLVSQLIKNCNESPVSIASMENCVHDLGRCLALLLMAWTDAPCEIREGMGVLHKDMMAVRFKGTAIEISRGDSVVLDLEDVVVRVKRGEESAVALLELGFLIQKGLVGEEESGGVILMLLNRLGSGKNWERLKIILLLRSLAGQSEENKVTI